jgi:hypothetical protein
MDRKNNLNTDYFALMFGDFGFGLFLFFLYKLSIFTFIQLKFGISSMQLADSLIMGSFLIVLVIYVGFLIFKIENFTYFSEKIKNKSESLAILSDKLINQDSFLSGKKSQKD